MNHLATAWLPTDKKHTMKTNTFDRRTWLKRSALTAGGLGLMPFTAYCDTPLAAMPVTAKGLQVMSPFFGEYIPAGLPEKPLLAKLNANENPYGPSPKATAALSAAMAGGNRYGWRELMGLMERLSEKEGVSPKHLLMGPGSSDLLEKTAMVFFQGGGNVVSADPSYMSLIQVAKSCGASWKPVPLKADWSHDLPAMEAAIDDETKLVYICNPNNPTGTITAADGLREFCARVSERVPVFVDEAYLDFLEDGMKQSMVSLIAEGKNVIVARTFSKIHGMAGLRVGYAVGLPETLERINAITRAGMGIACTSIAAADASLSDTEFLKSSRERNAEVRQFTFEGLRSLGHDPVASHTSFMIFPIALEGREFLDKMSAQRVGVRAFEFLDKKWCRVSMGTRQEMEVFLAAIAKTLV